ncbi:MAG: uracil-DNA glycosylase family protein [Saprospiraceae bacterium]|nr:uracil-DNA glycosylase family protein [Saprospiraceae bacterium]
MFTQFSHPITNQVRSCTNCYKFLPEGPRPIFRVHPNAKIALISQAPGRVAHHSGHAWADKSGNRLRTWLNVSSEIFYETPLFAVIPMGFCYPGKGKSGDLPPRPECAPLWHAPLLELMPELELFILIGQFAQKAFLGPARKKNLTETVRHANEYLPQFFPIPHPSPLNQIWIKKNPWFAVHTIPLLQKYISRYNMSL